MPSTPQIPPTRILLPREYVATFLLVTSLFALWGFANDITNPMVAAFKNVLEDATKFTPIGSIDTASLPASPFTAASLRAAAGESLGTFRWIAWQTSPVTAIGENTAWQEFHVETAPR